MSRRIFVDANLIGVARVLAEEDARILYPGHPAWPFSQDAPDEEWLAYIGKRDGCVILRDKRIRFRPPQRAVLEAHRVRAVVIATSRNLTIAENVALLRRHWKGVEDSLAGPPAYRHLNLSGFRTMLEYGHRTHAGSGKAKEAT